MTELEISARLAAVTGALTVEQRTLAQSAKRRLAGASRQLQQVVPFTYEHSGIAARHFELDPELAERRVDWIVALNEATRSLAARAFSAVLARGERPGALLVASSTHGGFPGLSRWLQHRFELAPETFCLDLGGTGCAGAPHALYTADLLLRSGIDRVCVLCVDALGTLSQLAEWSAEQSMSELVARCLASDGAAAVMLRRGPIERGDGFSYTGCRFASRLWPGSLEWNVFSADAHNRPLFSVGKEIRTHLAGEVRAILAGVSPHAMAVHPGGAALMQVMAEAFPDLAPYLELSMQELEAHGNFGSPSVLRVLDLTLAKGLSVAPRLSLLAFGPGKVTAMTTYEGVRESARPIEPTSAARSEG